MTALDVLAGIAAVVALVLLALGSWWGLPFGVFACGLLLGQAIASGRRARRGDDR